MLVLVAYAFYSYSMLVYAYAYCTVLSFLTEGGGACPPCNKKSAMMRSNKPWASKNTREAIHTREAIAFPREPCAPR